MARVIEAFKQFLDGAGDPLANGWLLFLESGTVNTEKDTYIDSSETLLNTNPLQLDAEGRCSNVFGTGTYKVVSYTNDELLNAPSEQLQVFDPVGGAIGVSDFNDWNAGQLYQLADIVKGSDGNFYKSLESDNQNNDPTTQPSQYWEQIDFLYIWNQYQTYSIGDVVTDPTNGVMYRSLVDSNLGNEPNLTEDVSWENWAVYCSAAEVRTEIDAGLVEIGAAGDDELSQIAAAGDAELVDIAAAGDTQVARVIAEGDTQAMRVETEGDTQVARVISAGSSVNRSIRQAYLSGPDLEATPDTVETAATKTGDLTDTYHDLDMDMLTGSRGGMSFVKSKTALGTYLQSSLFDTVGRYLRTDAVNALSVESTIVRQFTASGLQILDSVAAENSNLYAFQTTRRVFLDGNLWHYNPISGFAICEFIGNGASRELPHPMDDEPMFFAVKNTADTTNWLTGRYNTDAYMSLNLTNAEATGSTVFDGPHSNTFLNIGSGNPVNGNTDSIFIFGWFGAALDDIHAGMRGMRGVTASYIIPANSGNGFTVDTNVVDIQTIIHRKIDSADSWYISNKASGFGNTTFLDDTAAETTQSRFTVSGSEVTFADSSSDILVMVVGSTADRPDDRIKHSSNVTRKIGTLATGHRVDLGTAMSGGDSGGMILIKNVEETRRSILCDTLNGAGQVLYTDDTNALVATPGLEAFLTTGVQVGSQNAINQLGVVNQYTAFGTTHKALVGGLNWEYNPLSGFAMCQYTGDVVAGRTLTHPMGKKPLMIWIKDIDVLQNWGVYSNLLGADDHLYLNLTNAAPGSSTFWNSTEPDDTTITLGDHAVVNASGDTYALYAWFGDDLNHITAGMFGEEGASAMIKYTGGSGAINFDTGIKHPKTVIWKATGSTSEWSLTDLDTGLYYDISSADIEGTSGITSEGSNVIWAGGANDAILMVFSDGIGSGIDNDVILPASASEPAIASMANGFDEYGQIDVIQKLETSQVLNVTGDEGKKFIYMDSLGVLYFTDGRPEYLRDYVPYAKGNYVYAIDRAKMYDAAGLLDTAVFLGECMLDNLGNVYNIVTYNKGDIYVGDWFAGIVSTVFTFDNIVGHSEVDINLLGELSTLELIESSETTQLTDEEVKVSFDASLDAVNYRIKLRRTF